MTEQPIKGNKALRLGTKIHLEKIDKLMDFIRGYTPPIEDKYEGQKCIRGDFYCVNDYKFACKSGYSCLVHPSIQTDEELLRDIINHHNFKPSYMCSVGSMQTTDLSALLKEILKHFKRKD